MKRILIIIAIAAAAAVACNKEVPELPSGDGIRTLSLTAELPETKVNADKGKITWSAGDAVAVYNTTGTKFTLTLSDGAGTNYGKFSGSFSGTLATDIAVYPASLASDTKGVVSIPKFMERSDSVQPVMASALEVNGSEVNALCFHHVMSMVEVTLKDLPAFACALKLFSKTGAQLNGDYTINSGLNGVNCDTGNSEAGTNDRVLYFPYKTAYGSDASVKFYFPVAPYEYTDLKIRVLDGDESIIEGTDLAIKQASSNLKAGDYLTLPTVNVRAQLGSSRDQFIKVEGVKWAKGNLRAWRSGTQGEGWQEGWNIYDNQWESQYMLTATEIDGNSKGFSLNTDQYKETIGDASVYTHWDYFSWGTLSRTSRVHNAPVTCTTAEFDITGKVFYLEGGKGDISTAQELSGDSRWEDVGTFQTANSTLVGDLAFWASKGQYRMPDKSEIGSLYAKNNVGKGSNHANMQAGYYIVDGKVLRGILFTSCPSWSTTEYYTEAVELSDADMESGLFLPKIGERTTNSDPVEYNATVVNFFNAWGVYWSGTYGGRNSGFEDCARHINFTSGNAMTYGYTSKLSKTITGQTVLGNAIRPVWIPENERQ